jgi:hypothetical protein
MRSDMDKVIIERPRKGPRVKPRRGNRPHVAEWTGDDDCYAGRYHPKPRTTRWSSDLLSPLRRWLSSQVGRPWDKVWSEICSNADLRTTSGRHLREHVAYEVSIGNLRYDEPSRTMLEFVPWRGYIPVQGLYVHPRHGLLCLQPRRDDPRYLRQPDPREAAADTLEIGPQHFHLKRAGIWYEAQTHILPANANSGVPFDFYWRFEAHVISLKRELNTKALRKAGLKNDNDA